MILVLGSTGNVGREVARQLIAAGERPRLLVRNLVKASEFEGSADVHEGDLANESSLQTALADVEKLFLISSNLAGFELERRVIDAAKNTGLQHIVKLSAIGADNPVITFSKWHAEVEQHLMKSGLAWTMLRPGSFMTNALMFWAPTIKTQQAFYQPTGDGRWPSIAASDIAAVTVLALTTPGHEGKGYTITGDESMNGAEYAAVLSDVLGKPIKFVDVPSQMAKEQMLSTGMPVEYADAVINLMDSMRAGHSDFVTDTFQQLMGRKPVSFAEWVRQNKAAFQ